MKYSESRVYTALNADELEVGSKVIVADDILTLEVKVKDGTDIRTLTNIGSPGECSRFKVKCDNAGETYWFLAYLVEAPKEQTATCRELARWLAQGNGQCRDIHYNDIVCTILSYRLSKDNSPVSSDIEVRRWGDDDWHAVTKEYLEGGSNE